MARVQIASRPYLLTFPATGATYPLTSEEVERLAASYPLVSCSANRLVLRADDGQSCTVRPATLGGGPAFVKGAQ
jgi:hypothetical protein